MSNKRIKPNTSTGHRILFTLLVVVPACLTPHKCLADDLVVDSVMYSDPNLPAPRVVKTLPPRLPALWLEALQRPEADMKCQAAQALALAHQRGLPGMTVAIEPLVRELGQKDQHPTVRVAVARALVVLDAKDKAAELAAAGAADPALRELIDPALAGWDHKPARAGWLERLNQTPNKRDTVLAIQCLTAVREDKAATRLRELALDGNVPPAIRLEAAKGLGLIRPTGAEKDAQALAGNASVSGRNDRLVAAFLLRHHQGEETVRLLQVLGRDSEPTVAGIALSRLVEIDPKHLLPLLDHVLPSADAIVRKSGVEALYRQPTDAHLRLLGDRLNDAHPDLRIQARKALHNLGAKPEFREIAIREGNRLLEGSDWRGLEQATILLAQLDHKPAAGRLVKLLPHARPEVFVTAAWGLRRLAVRDTLAPALEYFIFQYKNMLVGSAAGRADSSAPAVDRQLSHVAQFLGQGRHREADAALRRLIPPTSDKGNPAGMEARAGAIWALGLLHEGKPVNELVSAFSGRLSAVNPFDVEDARVRQMSAVALGRMKATLSLDTLRGFYKQNRPALDPINNACGWAIEQITGEKVPEPGTVEVMQRGWFLEPAK
jgi:HEAT repeat protein